MSAIDLYAPRPQRFPDRPELDYEAAPIAACLRWARAILNRFYKQGDEHPETTPGPCNDCQQNHHYRFTYGHVEICRLCLSKRRECAVRLASARELRGLSESDGPYETPRAWITSAPAVRTWRTEVTFR